MDLEHFHTNGFALIKNVFSQQEIQGLRDAIDRLKQPEEAKGNFKWIKNNQVRISLGDLPGKQGLDHLLFDERILSVARRLIGPRLVYFGESNFQIGVVARGWHRDNADRQDPQAPDWHSEDHIIKFGIYLQDHARNSGGLKVRVGSHLISDFLDPHDATLNNQDYGRGMTYNIPSQAGDVMVWSMKIAHSANFTRLRLMPGKALSPQWESRLENRARFLLVPKEKKERIALWIALGSPSTLLDRYLTYYVNRGDFVDHWQRSRFDQNLVHQARSVGMDIVRPIPEYGSKYA